MSRKLKIFLGMIFAVVMLGTFMIEAAEAKRPIKNATVVLISRQK